MKLLLDEKEIVEAIREAVARRMCLAPVDRFDFPVELVVRYGNKESEVPLKYDGPLTAIVDLEKKGEPTPTPPRAVDESGDETKKKKHPDLQPAIETIIRGPHAAEEKKG